MAALDRANLKDQQEYDIKVALTLPRSPGNVARGNFMLELLLLDTGGTPLSTAARLKRADFLHGKAVLAASSRPAVLPYQAPLVSIASDLLLVGYKMLFPSTEKTTLVVPMAERLSFGRNARLPTSLLLDIRQGQALRTYSAQVIFVARLRGLRWVMYNWRISAFVIFTTLFWAVEVVSMLLAFLAFGVLTSRGKRLEGRVKKEEEQSVVPAAPAIKSEPADVGAVTWSGFRPLSPSEESDYDDKRRKNGGRRKSPSPHDGTGSGSASGVVRRRTSPGWNDDG